MLTMVLFDDHKILKVFLDKIKLFSERYQEKRKHTGDRGLFIFADYT